MFHGTSTVKVLLLFFLFGLFSIVCPKALFYCSLLWSKIARWDDVGLQNNLTKILTTEASVLVSFLLPFCFVLFQALSLQCPLLPRQPTRIHFSLISHQTHSGLQWKGEEKLMEKWHEGKEQNTRAMHLSNDFLFTQVVNTLFCISDLRRWEMEIVWVSLPTGIFHPLRGKKNPQLKIGKI